MKKVLRIVSIATALVGAISFTQNTLVLATTNKGEYKEITKEEKKAMSENGNAFEKEHQELDTLEVRDEELKENNIKSYVPQESNFKSINPGEYVGEIVDSWKNTQKIYYTGVEKDPIGNSDYMALRYKVVSDDGFAKDDFYTLEMYTKDNKGNLYCKGKSELRSLGYKTMEFKVRMIKSAFNDPYLYVRLGASEQSKANNYSGTLMFKIKNPYYQAENDYINHWAKVQIEDAMKKGWVNSSSTFRPDDSITRAEFVKIVNRALGFKNNKVIEKFNDVKANDWFYNDINIALSHGYIDSKNTNFRPNDTISREEVAAIITTIKKNKDINLDKLKKYSDYNKVSEWAKSSVEGAIEAGYMGQGEKRFRPKDKITRAEAIVTLTRVTK